jgi:prolyl oligopeptidase
MSSAEQGKPLLARDAPEAAMGRAMLLAARKSENARRRYSRREALGLLGSAAAMAGAPAFAQPAPSQLGGTDLGTSVAPSDSTVEILHGIRVEDPFRPLEDPSRADVQAWIAAEDRRARALLEGNPLHARVTAFLRASSGYPQMGGLRRVGRSFVSWAFDGTKEQRWLEIRNAVADPGRILIDPNTMGPGGSVSLWSFYPDRLATKIAYVTAENGGDAQVLRIRDMRTGLDLLDRLEGCRWTSVAWLPDGNSFYYVRPPLPSEPEDWDRSSHHLFYHQLGYPQAADRMVWRFPRRTNVFMTLRRSYATNQLMVSAGTGTDEKRGYWVGPLANASLLTMLVPIGLSSFWAFRNNLAAHYAVTEHNAPRGRIVRIIQGEPRPGGWQTIVPESEGVIDGATIKANRLIVRRFKDLGHQLAIYDLEGRKQADVEIAGTPRITFERGDGEDNELYVDVDDRLHPARIERLDVSTGRLETFHASKAPHNLADMQLRQVRAKSKDGTEVPITLVHRPDVTPDGSNRTLLYGYGGYGISQWPFYSSFAAAWLRLGGVYAVAVIRGGGEFGSAWHEGGRLAKQQNSLDDFAAAAEWLIANGITRRERLGIFGASNGGRLVLATMLQRPELFGAVVSGVPVADMVRFHKFTFGVAWKPEYGDPDKPDAFNWLMAYSPLHNVKSGRSYPPLMILTADNDQRVAPAHAYKMAATLRAISPATEVHVRTRRGAGHGGGNAFSKSIEYQADIISFLVGKLGGPILELPRIAK